MPRPDIESRRKDSREYAARRLAEDPDYHKRRRLKTEEYKRMSPEQLLRRKKALQKDRDKKRNKQISQHRAKIREKTGAKIRVEPEVSPQKKRQLPGPGITLRVHARPSKALTAAWKDAEMRITPETKFVQGPSFTGDRWTTDLENSKKWGKR
jgi:hypothetical protein